MLLSRAAELLMLPTVLCRSAARRVEGRTLTRLRHRRSLTAIRETRLSPPESS